jgi:predicted nucleotide-binding protein with TIR-like domain
MGQELRGLSIAKNHQTAPYRDDTYVVNWHRLMRFSRGDQYTRVVECIKQTLQCYGLNALRADDQTYKDQLWDNVSAYMGACRYGIAIFEDIDHKDFNPNVSIELGYMLGTKPPLSVLILKERRLASMPTDILGHLYKEFDAFHIQETIAPAVGQWLRDIGIAKSVGEKRLLYVSHGGTWTLLH